MYLGAQGVSRVYMEVTLIACVGRPRPRTPAHEGCLVDELFGRLFGRRIVWWLRSRSPRTDRGRWRKSSRSEHFFSTSQPRTGVSKS